MKTLLRLLRRGILYLVAQSSYPTSRERMMGMFTLGKAQGRKEALKELPITQVQPRQMTARVYLPPGEWTRQYRASHLIVPPIIRTNTEPIDQDDSWLNSVPKEPTFAQAQAMLKQDIAEVPTARDIAPKFDPLNTDEYPAVVKLLHQKRQQERHAS